MLPLHSLSLHTKPPLPPFALTNKLKTCISELVVSGNALFNFNKKKTHPYSYFSSSSSSCIVYAAENESESQQFEVDPDEAREALKILDQQLRSRSKTQPRPPKQKAPDVSFSRDEQQVEEFSGSFFTIIATAVFIFTIFYNVLFYTVIKPSIDGPQEAPTAIVQTEISN